ncbi:unnamed protein product [Rotaria sp. Silwood1]|nr:unnamed protein product [Rotaria sp. Silwood1]CAF3643623.1 unnamed protein product [Rotaria sp. Silwood1]CAF3708701.1 unnamed protein product [Rotaria sp. Silwood1]CAF4687978.1 unnamed protein product [Rotaria sp. Silwood1]CAF4810818.1 unnamed protein product [Rotaria sp. Silwood1]
MDPYYSSPSYYYQSSCPLHDSYVDPYSSYPTQSTPSHYYPSYIDQSSSSPQIVLYNNSTTNIYAQPTPPVQSIQSTPVVLNKTFELAPPVGRRRRQRTIFSKDQVDILDLVFEKNQYPDIQLREQLSQRLDVPEARIQVWFKNRRSRARTTNKTQH